MENNPLHDELHRFVDAYLEHVPDLQEYCVMLIGLSPRKDDPTLGFITATQRVTDGLGEDTVKKFVEDLVNGFLEEREEEENAIRH
jgi:hypothetical protein